MESSTAQIETQRNLTSVLTATLLLFAVPLLSFMLIFLSSEHDIDVTVYNENKEELQKDSPFHEDLNDCMEETGATENEVRDFLHRMPLQTHQGKCFVACVMKKSDLILNDKIDEQSYLKINKEMYGEESEITEQLEIAMNDCLKAVKDLFEACEYASVFNDCMAPKTHEIMRIVDEKLQAEMMRQMESQSNGHHGEADGSNEDWEDQHGRDAL